MLTEQLQALRTEREQMEAQQEKDHEELERLRVLEQQLAEVRGGRAEAWPARSGPARKRAVVVEEQTRTCVSVPM